MQYSFYSKVAFFWGVVFLAVGCLFCFAPASVQAYLTAWAQLIGLSGEISAPSGTLWHILSLSLMAIITFCAFASAKYPENCVSYRALLVAKITSVLGFSALAIQEAPAWIICAVGDGFVALSLWYAYRKSSRKRQIFCSIKGDLPA